MKERREGGTITIITLTEIEVYSPSVASSCNCPTNYSFDLFQYTFIHIHKLSTSREDFKPDHPSKFGLTADCLRLEEVLRTLEFHHV